MMTPKQKEIFDALIDPKRVEFVYRKYVEFMFDYKEIERQLNDGFLYGDIREHIDRYLCIDEIVNLPNITNIRKIDHDVSDIEGKLNEALEVLQLLNIPNRFKIKAENTTRSDLEDIEEKMKASAGKWYFQTYSNNVVTQDSECVIQNAYHDNVESRREVFLYADQGSFDEWSMMKFAYA